MLKRLNVCKFHKNKGNIKETGPGISRSLLVGIGKSRWKRNVENRISLVVLLRLLGFLYRSELLII